MVVISARAPGWALRGLAIGLVGGWLIVSGGCEAVGYYSQAVFGQVGVLSKRQPVSAVVAELEQSEDPDQQSMGVLAGLRVSQKILTFAESELGMNAGKRYRTYVELGNTHVVWNVFAAPELDLEPRRWCYPVVGCAPYRGYFDEARAGRYAKKLQRQGYDVYLGGVSAYSTLGWFEDPLLSSFIDWPEADLAELLIHELAHGQVWVKGDVEFNEAFATFVGRRGAARWIEQRQGSAGVAAYMKRRKEWASMAGVLEDTRSALHALYQTDLEDTVKRAEKQAVLQRAITCYERNGAVLGGGRFDSLMARLNNAYLVSVATYQENVGAFARIYSLQNGDWRDFYRAVSELGRLPVDARDDRLTELSEEHVAHRRDDQRADQIQCESFFGHGLD
ncbi:MAG: aminopeptidase [Gammaproteobacteria bacterium]|nr:aminopeptidase [Gammaproteobacteria bacterium]